MAEAYRHAVGDLADRLLAALEAGQSAGGNIRGQQSAAMVIDSGVPTGRPWLDRILDLRVEDHPEPLTELSRLITVHRVYQHMNAGALAFGQGDYDQARQAYAAAETVLPANLEIHLLSRCQSGQYRPAR